MKKSFISFLCLYHILMTGLTPLFALDGERVGSSWTDWDGTNYEGDAPSGGSSDYGWQYTYGYVNGEGSSSNSRSTWADRQEINRLNEEARIQQQATQINDQGVEYAKQGNYQKALESYQAALALNPADSIIQNNVRQMQATVINEEANQYYNDGNYQMAVDAYRRALEIKPESEVIQQNLEGAQWQLSYQRDYEGKQALKKAEMTAAGSKIQGMLTDLSQSIKPKARSSGLSFKSTDPGGEAPTIAGKEELAFKGMEARKPPLEARGPAPVEESKTVKGQLNSVEFHSQAASRMGSYEGMKENAAIGFDTKGIAGDDLPTSTMVRVPEVRGAAVGEVLPPPVAAEKRTAAIEKYETERGQLFIKRKELEAKTAELEKSENPDPVKIVMLREEASQIKNKENFLSFQITEELAQAPEAEATVQPDPAASQERESNQ